MAKRRTAVGERRHEIELQQRKADAVDESGAPLMDDEQWNLLSLDYAARWDAGGEERFAASQLSAPYETHWRIGYRPDMDPEVIDVPKVRRLRFRGRAHDITKAEVLGTYEEIELLTLARQG